MACSKQAVCSALECPGLPAAVSDAVPSRQEQVDALLQKLALEYKDRDAVIRGSVSYPMELREALAESYLSESAARETFGKIMQFFKSGHCNFTSGRVSSDLSGPVYSAFWVAFVFFDGVVPAEKRQLCFNVYGDDSWVFHLRIA